MNKIILTIIIVVAAVSMLLVVLKFGFQNPFSEPGLSIDLSRQSVVKEIESLGRLETSSFKIEKIIEAGQDGNIFQDLLYGDKILLIASGKVVAGVDLTKIKKDDIVVEGEKLTVTLPAPEIFSSALDSSRTRVYDRKQGVLSRGNKDLETEARKAAESSIREAACEGDILDQAREGAKKRITELFKFAGFKEVVVIIPIGKC